MSTSEYLKLKDLAKDFLLNESKTFCMYPWTHLNATPLGNIFPCCSNDYTMPIANTADVSLKEAFNGEFMKNLRMDMLNEKHHKICDFCYSHEEAGPHSFRKYSIEHFGKYFDESLEMTHEDGHVDEMKMRYFDIRFSNICNFKCRSCGSEFSSQWALEDKKSWKPDGPVIIHVDNEEGGVLEEILDQVDHIDIAYFAGGEPLITPEHYVILEELIRKGKTDTVLRYNTNASTVSYKDKDIFALWKHFDKVEVSCSIDHFGQRAECMRHGTDWGRVETNLKKFRATEHISFQMNTVLSIMNYYTLYEFFEYMSGVGLLDYDKDFYNSLYLAANPKHYCAQALPKSMKETAAAKLMGMYQGERAIDGLIKSGVGFAAQNDTWEDVKKDFFHMTYRLNKLRGEDFFDAFPELKPLQDME
jgi:MoaA/NifB/PqqE/SkfB family radical SAM enzyme